MNSATLPASGDAAANVASAAPADGLPLDPALAAAQGAQSPLAFLQFMQMDAAIPVDALAQPEPGAAVEGDAAAVPANVETQEEGSEASGEAAQPLLAAMSMPLTPAMMTMPAALPSALRLAAGSPERQERAAEAVPAAAGAVELPSAPAARGEAAVQAAQPALAAESAGAHLARNSAAAVQASVAPQPAAAATAQDGAAADGQSAANSGAAGASAALGVAAPAAPSAAPRDGGTLTLSGPPTAWRQSLQEALGDRLNLAVGKNAEQAVIRLEPPMLGRVEISIRHAAGSLEVNITATHGEVLRQLNTVSDNLRSDLAQRQYTDVSVNVSQAPARAQAGAQAGGFADAQGRGRQQGQDQDERAPGAALAEANQSTTAFSLGGRA